MPTFRKKPVVIEAEQFDGGSSSARGVCYCAAGDGLAHVHTIHDGQLVHVERGDWILPEPTPGRFYPCTPAIFAATYEPVEG